MAKKRTEVLPSRMKWEEIMMSKFTLIKVGLENNELKIMENPNNYKLIGVGYSGAVFQLSPKQCVKIYYRAHYKSDKQAEEEVLKITKDSRFFPDIYEVGKNYIIMEYIEGEDLGQYLDRKGKFPSWLANEILLMLEDMKQLRLPRCDAAARHIIVQKNEKQIKVIDHVNSMKVNADLPERLLRGLQRRGVLNSFLEHVKKVDEQKFNEWKRVI